MIFYLNWKEWLITLIKHAIGRLVKITFGEINLKTPYLFPYHLLTDVAHVKWVGGGGVRTEAHAGRHCNRRRNGTLNNCRPMSLSCRCGSGGLGRPKSCFITKPFFESGIRRLCLPQSRSPHKARQFREQTSDFALPEVGTPTSQ